MKGKANVFILVDKTSSKELILKLLLLTNQCCRTFQRSFACEFEEHMFPHQIRSPMRNQEQRAQHSRIKEATICPSC